MTTFSGMFTEQDRLYMQEALTEARAALTAGEVPVGAVVVSRGRIVGRGHNRRETDQDISAHAEILALREAGRTLGGWRLGGAFLYVTLEPCPMCAAAIVQARISRVIFGADDPRLGAGGSLLNLLQFPGFGHDVAVRSGLMAEEAGRLLQEFFSAKR
ncbi:MAG: tRNA adenosine(34) deaminase TadA [Peptococcaceae bacterium]|nr:tRNA adenosine(34) deaminase TadA [Peptococcaceae bacterium]